MKTIAIVIAYALVVSILLAVIYAVKSARLQNRFQRLGAVQGRALEEIVRVTGEPNHRSKLGANRELLEWRRVGFHIALTFTDGLCDGVAHESRE